MPTSLRTKILITLMIVGVAIASVGLGANSRNNQPEPVAHTQASGFHLAPIAGYLIWGGLALVFGCFIPLILGLIRQQRAKASS